MCVEVFWVCLRDELHVHVSPNCLQTKEANNPSSPEKEEHSKTQLQLKAFMGEDACISLH